MKIGLSATLIAPSYIEKFKMDGIGVYTKFLLDALEQEHRDVQPFYFKGPKSSLLHKMNHDEREQPYCLFSALLPKLINIHKDMEKEIDVFHSTDYQIPRLKNKPVVATLHDAIMFKESHFASQRLRYLKNYLLKKSAHWANHYITVSQSMVDDLVNYWHVPEEKISVVHNGVDDIWLQAFTEEEKKAVLKKFGIEKPFILAVGTLQPRKNIERLIDAYQALPKELKDNFNLVIVGRDGWSTQSLLPKINALCENKQGHWLKYVEFDDLRALYQAASLFVFPSLSEGFGIPVIEAFASKTPVIASNTSSLPEVAGDAAILVDPEQVDAISSAMEKVLDDKSLQESLIEKGYERVKDFSWRACAQKTYDVYERLS